MFNVHIMYGEYSKRENHDLFGYTYIKNEQKQEAKPKTKNDLKTSKVYQATLQSFITSKKNSSG